MGRSRYGIAEPDRPHFMTYTVVERLHFTKQTHKEDRVYQLWQEGVHPELKFSEAMMHEKLNYIHINPVKRGYVSLPEHWRYSSAGHYMGLSGLIDIDSWWLTLERLGLYSHAGAWEQ